MTASVLVLPLRVRDRKLFHVSRKENREWKNRRLYLESRRGTLMACVCSNKDQWQNTRRGIDGTSLNQVATPPDFSIHAGFTVRLFIEI
jgi:hypothetical protein